MAYLSSAASRALVGVRGGGSLSDARTDIKRRRLKADNNAEQSRERYEEAVGGFDPVSYMSNAARALFANAGDQYETTIAGIDQQNNARGFYHSPVGRAGARRSFDDYLGRGLASLSGEAARMEMGRMGMMGGMYDADRQDSQFYTGADVDLLMSKLQQDQANKASKRGMWGSIASGLGTLGGAAILASDRTLKKKVRRGKKVLPRARRLRGESWEWNEKGRDVTGEAEGTRRNGVMAQDVEREFPELVSENPRTGTKQVDYGGLASTLVNAIGELAEEVDELKVGRAGAALMGR